MRSIKKVLVHLKSKKKFYIKDLHEDFHTEFGVISKKDYRKSKIKSSKEEKFIILDPLFSDLWDNLHRAPQIMIQKDIGLILAKTGINKNSKVVDAGGGSGALCLSLANVCKEITVYETNPEHYDVVAKNVKLFGINNLNLKQANIYQGIKEKKLDLITLDLPEPWQVTEHAISSLKNGGHLVVYLPNLSQVKLFVDSTKRSSIEIIEIIETLERKWQVNGKIMRPEFQMLGHTGFLIFCRKLQYTK